MIIPLILAALNLTSAPFPGMADLHARFYRQMIAVPVRVTNTGKEELFMIDSSSPDTYYRDASKPHGTFIRWQIGKETILAPAKPPDDPMPPKAQSGIDIAGVIGCDVLSQIDLEMDFAHRRALARIPKAGEQLRPAIDKLVTVPLVAEADGTYSLLMGACGGPKALFPLNTASDFVSVPSLASAGNTLATWHSPLVTLDSKITVKWVLSKCITLGTIQYKLMPIADIGEAQVGTSILGDDVLIDFPSHTLVIVGPKTSDNATLSRALSIPVSTEGTKLRLEFAVLAAGLMRGSTIDSIDSVDGSRILKELQASIGPRNAAAALDSSVQRAIGALRLGTRTRLSQGARSVTINLGSLPLNGEYDLGGG